MQPIFEKLTGLGQSHAAHHHRVDPTKTKAHYETPLEVKEEDDKSWENEGSGSEEESSEGEEEVSEESGSEEGGVKEVGKVGFEEGLGLRDLTKE